MPDVIQILGDPFMLFPADAPPIYVKSYDPDGELQVTEKLDEAKLYGPGEAIMERQAVSTVHPKRLDGKPNRPLSRWTIVIMSRDKAREDAAK